jgi:hypothetical protein
LKKKTVQKTLKIGLMACEKQKEEGSCGINTIAFATAPDYGLNPCELRFDLSQLRPHLIHCLSKGTLDLFPTIGKGVHSNWRPKKLCPCPSLAFAACPTLETQNFFQKNSTTWCNAKFAKNISTKNVKMYQSRQSSAKKCLGFVLFVGVLKNMLRSDSD